MQSFALAGRPYLHCLKTSVPAMTTMSTFISPSSSLVDALLTKIQIALVLCI